MTAPTSTPRQPTAVDAVADAQFDAVVAASPIEATHLGVPGAESELDDLSPDGYAHHAQIARDTLARLDTVEAVDAVDRVTVAAMRERLGLEHRAARGRLRPDGAQRHRVAAAGVPRRLRPDADRHPGRLGDHRDPAHQGAGRPRAVDDDPARVGRPGPRDPAATGDECIAQCAELTSPDGFFSTFVAGASADGTPLDDAVRADLERGVAAAATAYQRWATTCAPTCSTALPRRSGGPRALRSSPRASSSAPRSTSRRPTTGASRSSRGWTPSRSRHRRADPAGRHGRGGHRRTSTTTRAASCTAPMRSAWMQERADEAIVDLADTHFDIPEPVRTHRVPDRRRPTTAASTTPGRATTSAARAGCGGRCPRASPSSTPGAS